MRAWQTAGRRGPPTQASQNMRLLYFSLLFLEVRDVASANAIEIPQVAVCISGAARSLATVPVLRGLKRMVLQNPAYTASAFAALSYDTNSPQLLDYNTTLAKRLSMSVSVRRALAHLKPELKQVAYYNTTAANERFRSCQPSDKGRAGTEILALYSMQVCYSLIRAHEAARRDERFDFIMRVRPDHLFLHPVAHSIGVNVSSWPRDRMLTHAGDSTSFAIVPRGVVATIYFRTFTAASSCLFREKQGDEHLPASFPASLQCASLQPWDNLARCVVRANMLYHGLPLPRATRRRPALIARICNLNASSGKPEWPTWPMPPGETCVTNLDMLKRPRVAADRAAAMYGDGASSDGRSLSWNLTLLFVACVMAYGCYSFRERIQEDAAAAYALGTPLIQQAWAAAEPTVGPIVMPIVTPIVAWYRRDVLGQPAQAVLSAADSDDE